MADNKTAEQLGRKCRILELDEKYADVIVKRYEALTGQKRRRKMEFKKLCEINKNLKSVDIKGKKYVEVCEKVLGFRELYPNGCISTDMLSNDNGVCIIQAKVFDENGAQIGSGIAYEKENSSFINKTSYIENCETSAIGRALSSLGIGSQDSYASANEVENAIANQTQKKATTNDTLYATLDEKKKYQEECSKLKVDSIEILKQTGWQEGDKMTKEHLSRVYIILEEIKEEREEK